MGACVLAALVGGYLVVHDLLTPDPYAVPWELRGTADGGRTLLVGATLITVGLCDDYTAEDLEQPARGPARLTLTHRRSKDCDGDQGLIDVGLTPRTVIVRLDQPLDGRRVGGHLYQAVRPDQRYRASPVELFGGRVPGTIGLSLAQARMFWRTRGVTPTIRGGGGKVIAQTPVPGTRIGVRNTSRAENVPAFLLQPSLSTPAGRLRMELTTDG